MKQLILVLAFIPTLLFAQSDEKAIEKKIAEIQYLNIEQLRYNYAKSSVQVERLLNVYNSQQEVLNDFIFLSGEQKETLELQVENLMKLRQEIRSLKDSISNMNNYWSDYVTNEFDNWVNQYKQENNINKIESEYIEKLKICNKTLDIEIDSSSLFMDLFEQKYPSEFKIIFRSYSQKVEKLYKK